MLLFDSIKSLGSFVRQKYILQAWYFVDQTHKTYKVEFVRTIIKPVHRQQLFILSAKFDLIFVAGRGVNPFFWATCSCQNSCPECFRYSDLTLAEVARRLLLNSSIIFWVEMGYYLRSSRAQNQTTMAKFCLSKSLIHVVLQVSLAIHGGLRS